MLIGIGRRNLFHKPLHSALLIALVTFVVGIVTVVMLLGNGFKSGLVKATEPFDLLVGAKGSPNQLVLNTVFLQDKPIGNISHKIVAELNSDTTLVERAIPLAFGDNYRGFRIVGTDKSIFAHSVRPRDGEWLKLAQGRIFEHNYEAVIGAETAQRTGLKQGDTFKSVHGVVEVKGSHSHDQVYTVVGILHPVKGPYDQAIFVTIDSVWAAHGHGHTHTHDANSIAHANKHGEEKHEEHNAALSAGHDAETTVIMVKPKGYGEAMQLYQKFQKEERAQMIFPAQVIVQLFAMMGQGQEILTMVSYAVITMMLLTLSLTMYWVGLNRVREQAVLRALGATRRDLFIITFAETALLLTAGAIAGWLLGEGIYIWMVSTLQAKTAITMDVGFYGMSILAVLMIVALGLLFAIIPAWLTYKKDLAAHL